MLYTHFIRLTLVCILSFAVNLAIAQPKLPEVRELSRADLSMTECAFDSGANAVVLFDAARVINNRNGSMRTEYRKRVKILNKNGLDEANVIVYCYSKDDFEIIEEIEGETANVGADGFPVWTALDKKSVFSEKMDEYRTKYKIVMPNVVEGSVFEIRYVSVMKHYGGLEHWDFQSDLPVQKSCFYLELPADNEFVYTVQKNPQIPIIIKPIPTEGKIYYEMNNVPALDFEPYMDAVSNYKQRVIFQQASYSGVFGDKTKVSSSWDELVNELMSSVYFGKELNKNVSTPELDLLVASEATLDEKAATIYRYVINKVKWDGYNSKHSSDGVKKTLSSGEGTAGEINLLLINLLIHYDIPCYPLLVAERNFGKVDVNYPYLDRFNKVVAYADIHGSAWIMDATQPEFPPYMAPYSLLNTIALVVDKKEPRLIRIVKPADKFEKNITVQAAIDKSTGNINGQVRIERKGYARFAASERINGRSVNPIADVDDEKMENVDIIKTEKLPVLSDSVPAVTLIDYKQNMPDDADILYYTSNLFMGMGTNPFNSKKRFTDVNFGYPIVIHQTETVKLPAGSTLKEEQPEQLVVSDDGQMKIHRKVGLVGDTLTISTSFQQGVTLVPAANYEPLRNFYSSLMQVLDQPVVIALGK